MENIGNIYQTWRNIAKPLTNTQRLMAWARRDADLATLAVATPLAAMAGWWIVGLCIELGGF